MVDQVNRKTIWIINQYGSTPKNGMGGRHFNLSRELASLGYNVVVIAASYTHILHSPQQVQKDIEIEHVGEVTYAWVKVPEYQTSESKRRVFNWFLFAAKISRLSKVLGHDADFVLCSSPSLVSFLGAEFLSRKMRAKLFFEVRDIWPLTLIEIGGFSPRHPFMLLLQWIENRAYRKSDAVISNLRDSNRHMIAHGMEPDKFHWVPNGFSALEIENSEPLSESVAQQIPTGKIVVGYTGSIGTANALHSLVDAARILKNNEKVHFVVVGKGALKPELVEKTKELGLNNFTFIDPIPKSQIQAMLACFDICYIGLSNDPLFRFGVSPNKLFDYMCAGKPIIYAINSGDYQPVNEFECGLTVAPEDSNELAKAIETMAAMSETDLAKMGSNGKAAAYENHEYGRLAKRLSSIILDTDGSEALG